MTGRYMNRFKKDWIPEETLALMAFSKGPIHKLPNSELLNMGYERVTAADLSNKMREIVSTGHYFNTHKNALFEIDELADMHYKGEGIHKLPDKLKR